MRSPRRIKRERERRGREGGGGKEKRKLKIIERSSEEKAAGFDRRRTRTCERFVDGTENARRNRPVDDATTRGTHLHLVTPRVASVTCGLIIAVYEREMRIGCCR